MNANRNLNNVEHVLLALVKGISIPIRPALLLDELKKHPEYDGLLAISDVLHFFQIKNFAFEIPNENLPQLPVPFIVHTSINGGEFVVVTELTKDRITFSSQRTQNRIIDLELFKTVYKGISLVIQAYPLAIEKNVRSNVIIERLKIVRAPILFTLAGFLLLGLMSNHLLTDLPNISNNIFLFIVKSIGFALSVLLLIHSFDSNNPLVQKLCQHGNKINCNNLLNSNAAKAFLGPFPAIRQTLFNNKCVSDSLFY
jgi:ABC-type bacteriocin/lantibiotic exporter with double-glycine peptidase domain